MPIRPTPRRLRCARCGHQWLFAPNSDALIVDPSTCPRCGVRGGPIESRPAGPFSGSPLNWLERLLRRPGGI